MTIAHISHKLLGSLFHMLHRFLLGYAREIFVVVDLCDFL